MKKIDYKIYKDMQNIKQNFYNSNSNKLTLKDVKFVGSIDSVEVDNTTNTKIMIKMIFTFLSKLLPIIKKL